MGKQAALDKQASIGKRLHWAARRGPAAVASDAPLSVVLAAHPRLAKLKARLPLPLRPIAQVGVAYKAPDGTLLPSVPEDLDLLEQCEVGAAHGTGCVSAHCKSREGCCVQAHCWTALEAGHIRSQSACAPWLPCPCL